MTYRRILCTRRYNTDDDDDGIGAHDATTMNQTMTSTSQIRCDQRTASIYACVTLFLMVFVGMWRPARESIAPASAVFANQCPSPHAQPTRQCRRVSTATLNPPPLAGQRRRSSGKRQHNNET
ncbi:hypothetical protein V3C99_017597 [Haemonchus contortus]